MKSTISKLWKSEDWLAVWIGFIIIAVGCIAVLTDSFDFSAAKFSTWHLWEDLPESKSIASLFTGTFWVKLIRTFLVLGILFTAGVKLQGGKITARAVVFVPRFVPLVRLR